MSRFSALYINSDSEDENDHSVDENNSHINSDSEDVDNSEDESCVNNDSDEEFCNRILEGYNRRVELYKSMKGDNGITEVDLSGVTITKIKVLNYVHPSDWEGELSNGKHFYSRYRWGKYSFYVYDCSHDDFSVICDTPLICLYSDSEELQNALDGEVLLESNMLKLCKLSLSRNCIRVL